MSVAGRRRLVAQPGGLTSGFALHLVIELFFLSDCDIDPFCGLDLPN